MFPEKPLVVLQGFVQEANLECVVILLSHGK